MDWVGVLASFRGLGGASIVEGTGHDVSVKFGELGGEHEDEVDGG